MSEFVSQFIPEPHLAYNWMIVAYFFLGGLSAGAYLLSVAANRWLKDSKPLARNAALVAPLAMIPGFLLLVFDLGNPLRSVYLGLYFNPTSVLSWGSIFLGVFFGISALNALAHWWKTGPWEALAQKLNVLGVPCAIVVAGYTGILLNSAPGTVLWHNALLPVLFLNGGLISGIAVTILVSPGGAGKCVQSKLGRVVAGLVVLELLMVIAEMIMLSGGGVHSAEAAHALMAGPFSGMFWGIQIVCGAVIPILIFATGTTNRVLRVLASLLVSIGVYAMRHIVVIGGQIIG